MGLSLAGSQGRRLFAVFAGLLLATTLLFAQRAAADVGFEDTPPIIVNGTVSPGDLPYNGGSVMIDTDIEDDFSVFMAYAQVYGPEGFVESVMLIPSKILSAGGATYSGIFNAPPNYTDSPASYGVEIQATDTNGGFDTELIGGFEVEAQPQFDEFPYLAEASLTPPVVGTAGGQVKIGADATDNRGLGNVFAIVTQPDETQQEVQLEPVTWLHFEGRFKAPANPGATPEKYSVSVYAEDDIGQTSSESAGSFIAAPRTGLLNAWTSVGSYFGRVAIGDTATRLVVVRNGGGSKTQPIEASITTSGEPFAVQGAIAGKIDFTLAPGERRVFAVDFAPGSRGFKVGSAIISRGDGAQPDIAVSLSGQGVQPPAG